LWYSWFDRDLTVAGRVVLDLGENGFKTELVQIKKPILKIPSLAIHLNRDCGDNFTFNKETNLLPILATTIENQLGVKEEKIDEKSEEKKEEISHHSILVKLLAEELKCKVEQIIDFELCLSDFQDSVIGGIKEEFVFSQRLDNLMSCFCALDSYINTIDSLENDSDVRMITFFDHEEVGSNSMNGAGSTMISDILQRVTEIFKDEKTDKDALYTSISKSFIISSDMAHSCHPNYSDKHEVNHKIQMHKGPVVKVNVQQRYATSLPTSFLIKELAKKKIFLFNIFV